MTNARRHIVALLLVILVALGECWFVSLAVDLVTQGCYLMGAALLLALLWVTVELASVIVNIQFKKDKKI